MQHVRGRGEVHTRFRCEKLTEGDHLKDPGVEGRIILKWILQSAVGARTGLIWLRIGTGGGFL